MLYGSASSLRKGSLAAYFSISMEVAGSSAAPKWVIRKMKHWLGTTVWRWSASTTDWRPNTRIRLLPTTAKPPRPGCFQRARKNSVLNESLSGENQQAHIWHS